MKEIFNIRKHFWRRLASVVLIITFINQDIAWAHGPQTVKPAAYDPSAFSGNSFGPDTGVILPKDKATIEETYDAKSARKIINIQDAHASLAAQDSIASVLSALVADYDLKMVALEGSSGYIDTSFLKTFPDQKVKEKAARRLMEKGVMSAGEFFAAISDKDVALYGVEDLPLYRENVAQFGKLYGLREAIRTDIGKLMPILADLKNKIYSQDLISFEAIIESQSDSGISFASRWEKIYSIASRSGINCGGYKNLAKLTACLQMENGIDFEAANKERSALIDILSKKLSKDDLKKLISGSLDLKESKIYQGQYYTLLKDLTAKAGAGASCKDLNVFTDYIQLYESVDLAAISGELKAFEDAVRDRLLSNDDQRRLYAFSRYMRLVDSMLDLKFSSDDFSYFSNIAGAYDARSAAALIKELSGKYGIASPDIDLESIFGNIPAAVEFYRTAEKRNQAMLENTMRRMAEEGQTVAALVTGGYHTKGLTQLLKERKTSYLIILPKFDPSRPDRPYAAIITNKRSGYEGVLETGDYLAIGAHFEGIRQVRSQAELAGMESRLLGLFTDLIKDPSLTKGADVIIEDWSKKYAEYYAKKRWPKDFRPIPPSAFDSMLRSLAGVSGVTSKKAASSGSPRDMKGPRAPETDPIIKNLIVAGKVAEIFLAGDHLVAYRLGWVNGYDSAEMYEPNALFSEEIDINQIFTEVQQKNIIKWLSDDEHRISVPGSNVRNGVHFRIVLDAAAIDWAKEFRYSNISHASYGSGCIYIGELLLASLFSNEKDNVRRYLLDEHELRYLKDPKFDVEVSEKSEIEAIEERIEEVITKAPRRYRRYLAHTRPPSSREAAIKSQDGQDFSGQVHWGYIKIEGQMESKEAGYKTYTNMGIDPVLVSAGLFLDKPAPPKPKIDPKNIKMKMWAGSDASSSEWHDIKMDQVLASKYMGGVFCRFVGTIPAFFDGQFTFMYSLDGGVSWQWANGGPRDNIRLKREGPASVSAHKMTLFGEDVLSTVSASPYVIRLYEGNLNLGAALGIDISTGSNKIFAIKVPSTDETGIGSIDVDYVAERSAIVIKMQDVIAKDVKGGRDNKTREERGWDRALIEIPLEKGFAKRVIHNTDETPMGMSRTAIAIFLAKAQLDIEDPRFKALYDLLVQELGLRRLGSHNFIDFAARQEAEDSKEFSTAVFSILNTYINADEAYRENTDINNELMEIEKIVRLGKAWLLKKGALEQLRLLVKLGRYNKDRYLSFVLYSNEKDRLQELAYIERMIKQDPSFMSDIGINRSEVESIQVRYQARGETKVIYYLTFNMRNSPPKVCAVSILRSAYENNAIGNADDSIGEIDRSLRIWKQMSEKGLDCVPRIYAVRKVDDYRPKMLTAPLGGLAQKPQNRYSVDAGAVDPQNLFYNDFVIIAREFVEGYDVPGYCAHGCVTEHDRKLVQLSGVSAYFKMWKATQKKPGGPGVALLKPVPQNVVIRPFGSNYKGVVVNVDRLQDNVSLPELVERLQNLNYERGDIISAARSTLDSAEAGFVRRYCGNARMRESYLLCTAELGKGTDLVNDIVGRLPSRITQLSSADQAISRRNIDSVLSYLMSLISRDTTLPQAIRSALLSRLSTMSNSEALLSKINYYKIESAQTAPNEAVAAFTLDDNLYLTDGFLNDKPVVGEEDSLSNPKHLASVILMYILRDLGIRRAVTVAGVQQYVNCLLGEDENENLAQALETYALKSRIRFIMEKDVIGRDLVLFQRAEDESAARRTAKEFLDTIYMIISKKDKKRFKNDDELRQYLRRNFGVRKVIIAGGKGTRFSPSGIILKSSFMPDNMNTNIKLARRSAAFMVPDDRTDDIIVVDPATVFHVLKANVAIPQSVKKDMIVRLRAEIGSLVSRKEYDAEKGGKLMEAATKVITEGLLYTSSSLMLNDLPDAFENIERMAGIKDLQSRRAMDRVEYAVFRAILYDWNLIDQNKKDKFFGKNCMIMADSGEGHGAAYLEVMKKLDDNHLRGETKYTMVVYADSSGWGLDKYENVPFIAYLNTFNMFTKAGGTVDLPKVMMAVKSPRDGRAKDRAMVSVTEAGENGCFGKVPAGIKEWGAMSHEERKEAELMAKRRDPNFFTNANIFIYDIEWTMAREGSLLADYRHDLGDAVKDNLRPHEYWVSDFINVAALEYNAACAENPNCPPLTRMVYVGESAPEALKTLPKTIIYRDDLEAMIIKKIREMGVIVDKDVTISISSDEIGSESDMDKIIRSIFRDNVEPDAGVFGPDKLGLSLGPTRLKGVIYLDASVKIGRGAVLDGVKEAVRVGRDSVIKRGDEVSGTVKADGGVVTARPELRKIFLSEFSTTETGTTEAVHISDVDLSGMGLIVDRTTDIWLIKNDPGKSDREILEGIFGSVNDKNKTIDQIFLYGTIILEDTVRVENGTMLDGRSERVLLMGRTHVGKGVNLKGVKSNNSDFAGVSQLNKYKYKQPSDPTSVEIGNSSFTNSYIEFGAKVLNSTVINSCVAKETFITGSDILNEMVVKGDPDAVINRRLKRKNECVASMVTTAGGRVGMYIPGAYRLSELGRDDVLEIKDARIKMAEKLYGRFISYGPLRERMLGETERLIRSEAADNLTIQQIMQYVFSMVRGYIEASNDDPVRSEKYNAELARIGKLTLVSREYIEPYLQDIENIDLSDESAAREIFRKVAILSTRFNIIDFSIDPKVFNTAQLGAVSEGGDKLMFLDASVEKELGLDGMADFEKMVFGSRKGTFLFLTDNVGEAEADALLWLLLARLGHKVVIAAKDNFAFGDIDVGGVKDIIKSHPSLASFEANGAIRTVKSGSSSEGVFAHTLSEEVREALNDPSLIAIISKGQANLFNLAARNSLKVPFVTMLLSKSIASRRITGVAPRKTENSTVFWPIIAVVPKNTHVMDANPGKPGEFLGTLARFCLVNPEASPPGILPPSMDFLVTDECGEGCSVCWGSFMPEHKPVPIEIQKKAIDIMAHNGVRRIVFTGGEPLKMPGLVELLRHAKFYNMEVQLFTNARYFDEARAAEIMPYVNMISFSLDGYDEVSSVQSGRKEGQFSAVIRALDIMKRSYPDRVVQVLTVVTAKNRCYLEAIGDLLKERSAGLPDFKWKLNYYKRMGRSALPKIIQDDPFYVPYAEFESFARDTQTKFKGSLDVRYSLSDHDRAYLFMFPDCVLATTEGSDYLELGNILSENTLLSSAKRKMFDEIASKVTVRMIPARKGNLKLRPDFVIGIPAAASVEMELAVRKNLSAVGGAIEVKRFASHEEFAGTVTKGVFIDLTDSEFEKILSERELGKYIKAILAEAEAVKDRGVMIKLTAPCGRNELEEALTDITGRLKGPGPFSIEELGRIRAELETAVKNRKAAIGSVYNNEAMPASMNGMIKVPVTTERVLAFDMFGADNMLSAPTGIMNCIVYGDIFKDEGSIKDYIRAAGYPEEVVRNMVFVNKVEGGQPVAYERLIEKILSEAKARGSEVSRCDIGIRAAASDCLLGKEGKTEEERYLEVSSLNIDGMEIVMAMNSYQVLLKMLDRLPKELPQDTLTLDVFGIPGVAYDKRGIFKYLPPSFPIDYVKELVTYKRTIELLSSAA